MWQLGLRGYPALSAGAAVTALGGALTALWLPLLAALLVGWCSGILTYLAMALHVGFRMTPDEVRQRAADLDEGQNAVFGATLLAVVVSLGAVVLEMAGAQGSPLAGFSAALAGATVALSWTFVHVLFAHRYGHENAMRGGLDFPGGEKPDFAEFLYLAFTVGMTAQVSDVTTASRIMRRLVLVHALVAFVFNVAILAVAINLAAGLAG